jgi:hypothetical protein
MTDEAAIEDLAVLYVLGELPTEERAAFELRLDESVELRSLVGDLQHGTEALAQAVPQHLLPSGLWSEIESAIDSERTVVAVSFRRKWAWIGWAAAACFVGWLLLGRGAGRPEEPAFATAPEHGARTDSAAVTVPVPGVAPSPTKPAAPKESSAQAAAERPAASPPEPLQARIAALEGRMAEISQTLTQRPPITSAVGLGDIRFFQLPPAGQALGGRATALSPQMQRALLLALARELARQQPGGDGMQGSQSLAAENGLGVDFVDLVPGARGQIATNAAPELRAQAQSATDEFQATESTTTDRAVLAGTGGIAGFVNGDRTVLIVPGSSVPAGYDHVTVTLFSASGLMGTTLGSFSLTDNPAIVSVPRSGVSGSGDSLVFTAASTFQSGSTPLVIGVVQPDGSVAPRIFPRP